MRNTWLIVALVFTGQLALSQQLPDSVTADELEFLSKSIRPADIKKHLTVLASDEFAGRETGTEGNEKAAQYIAGQMEKMGLQTVDQDGDYFQRIEFSWSRWEGISIRAGGETYKHLWDFIAFPENHYRSPDSIHTDKVWFLGYGIEDENYNDYGYFDVEDKVILIYEGEPVDKDGISQLTGTTERSSWSSDPKKKAQLAYQKGARLVLIIDDDIQETLSENRMRMLGPRIQLNKPGKGPAPMANHIYISAPLAQQIIGKKLKKVIRARNRMQLKGKAKRIKLKTDLGVRMDLNRKTVESSNVIGMIEGMDESVKHEYVIVTAHFDHLGERGESIYNGADDNGSGTSTLIEIAEAFDMARTFKKGPRRSVVFLFVTGEEKGLLGSAFYVDHPLLPLENAVANVNVDMIGRMDDQHTPDSNYVYVIGSNRLSTELHEINEAVNSKYTELELDYTYNAKSDPNRFYYRSDHYNFAKKGIPAVFYFSGVHEDYHQPSDTVDKIMFGKTAVIGRLIFHTIWELAMREKRIEVDVTP